MSSDFKPARETAGSGSHGPATDGGGGRRDFLKNALAVSGMAASLGAVEAPPAQAQPGRVPGTKNHYYLPANDKTVHWGYFSKSLRPLIEVDSSDFVTIETLTHHANDDAERMVKGDPGAESVFHWDRQRKGVDRRGAGPMQPTLFGRAPAKASASTCARGRWRCAAPSRATSSRCASSTCARGPAPIPRTRARASGEIGRAHV